MNQSSNKNTQIAARVTAARKAAGFSQEEIGQRLGLSKAGYGHYERGRQSFTVAQLFYLSGLLGQSVEYFLGLEKDLTPQEDSILALYRHAKEQGLGDLALRTMRAIAADA
jgi:transcriptional regulator with XRE-family HTH domain